MLGHGALGQYALGQAFQVASAAGVTLSSVASVVAGAAAGNAVAAGATLTVTAGTVAGGATGATAPVLAAEAGGSSKRRPRRTWARFPDFVTDARANGVTLTAIASLISGRAAGEAAAHGAALVESVSLIPGNVSADGRAQGDRVNTLIRPIFGGATGTATTLEQIIPVEGVTAKIRFARKSAEVEGFDEIAYDNALILMLMAA